MKELIETCNLPYFPKIDFQKNLKIAVSYEKKICICDALFDLVPFVQFNKREKHRWKSVTFSKVAGFSLQLY